MVSYSITSTVKPVLRGHSKIRPKIGFQDWLLLNAGRKYCRMHQESILQYFRSSLNYHLSLRSLFFLFLSGHIRQVLLYLEYITVLSALWWQKLIEFSFLFMQYGNNEDTDQPEVEFYFNPWCANRNKSHLLFSSAEMFKKPLWQTVWTQNRLLL